jgi:hypothetical protein
LPVAFLPQIVVVRLEDLLAVRTTQGMATVRDGGVVKSEGINTPVHMMQQIKPSYPWYAIVEDTPS